MSGDLHEISAAIGALRSSSEEQVRQTRAIWERIDEVKVLLIKNSAVHQMQDRSIAQLEKKMTEEVDPAIEELQALRNRGIGVIATVGVVASLVGLKLQSILDWIWGAKP